MSLPCVSVGKSEITIKECDSRRVVTFRDIDEAHDRPGGTARKRFNDNKKHFIKGADYFVRNSDEARRDFGISAPNGLTLITESGYLMLVKSFTDDLAWNVQRELVNNYFRQKPEAPALPENSSATGRRCITTDELRLRKLYMKDYIEIVQERVKTLNALAGDLHYELAKDYYFSLHDVMRSIIKGLEGSMERLARGSEYAMGKRDNKSA